MRTAIWRGLAGAGLLFGATGADGQTLGDDPPARTLPSIVERGGGLFAQMASARDMLAVERWRIRATGFDRGDHALTLSVTRIRSPRAELADRFTHWDFAAAYRADVSPCDSLTLETRALLGKRRTAILAYGPRPHGATALATGVTWRRARGWAASASWIGARWHAKGSPLGHIAELASEAPLAGTGARFAFEAPVRDRATLTLDAHMLRVTDRDMLAAAPPRRADLRLAATLRAAF